MNLELMGTCNFNNNKYYFYILQKIHVFPSYRHWRRQVMCANMLSVLIVDDPDVPIQKEMIEVFFEGLVSHSIDIRRSTMTTLTWLLVLFKRVYPTVQVKSEEALKIPQGSSLHSILQYRSKAPAEGDAVWSLPPPHNALLHIHKIHYGYAALPKILNVKLANADFSDFSTNQPPAVRILLETTHKYLNDADYVAKLLEVWSLEDKAKTKSNKRAGICKAIARSNGPPALRVLLRQLHVLGTDKDQWKQKCAADMLCGILYGMKLWDEATTKQFWEEELRPVFNDCLNAVTQETMESWSIALTYPTVSWKIKIRFACCF